ncbi:MAG: glutathione S-transferase family protein [Panacagrimonas sp.]
MKMYYHPLSTYSQKAIIACHEKGAVFESNIVDLFNSESAAEYKKIYPLGKIPVLFATDDHMIPESSIIVEYVDQKFDHGPRLIPQDPELGRQTRFIDRVTDFYFNNNVASVMFESWKPEAERDKQMVEKAQAQIAAMYGYMEQGLEGKTWMMGDDFTLADCASAPPLFYAQQVAPFANKPNISAYFQRLMDRSSFQKVLAQAKPYLDRLQS